MRIFNCGLCPSVTLSGHAFCNRDLTTIICTYIVCFMSARNFSPVRRHCSLAAQQHLFRAPQRETGRWIGQVKCQKTGSFTLTPATYTFCSLQLPPIFLFFLSQQCHKFVTVNRLHFVELLL